MESELRGALRRLKPNRQLTPLQRRPDTDLPFVDSNVPLQPLLLDTTVYVDALEGSLPPLVTGLLLTRTLIHHTSVLAELSHLFGRLNPGHPGTVAALRELTAVIADIPPHRLESTSSPAVMMEAGILNGLVFRLGGFGPGQEVAALNDATLYLHALDRGYIVLTRNIRDFDYMNQIMPAGRVLFYRRT